MCAVVVCGAGQARGAGLHHTHAPEQRAYQQQQHKTTSIVIVQPALWSEAVVSVLSQIRVAMVTGDSRETAESIAHELGFFERGVDEALSGGQAGRQALLQHLT